MFVGRTAELKKLNQMYQSDQFEFAVLYGRRRVGKTTLINEFCADKKTIFYVATEAAEKENLAQFSQCIFKIMVNGESGASFNSFHDLLNYLDSICNEERLILVIDEYPYLAESCKAISSMIQAHIDQTWQNSKLFLILCGSSMSFMENQVLGYKSPLYGRRTAQFKIRPFTYFESRGMLRSFSLEEQAILYGVTGGIPEYLSRLNSKLSMDENLIQLFFEESGRLYEEPGNLLKQELKDPATYHSIISAVAQGASKLNEIATKVGIETSATSAFLSSLISLGLVKKEVPITEPANSRKTIYLLADQMFRFWYRFVSPNVSSIVWGLGEQIYYTLVKPQLNHYMGLIFEEICKEYCYQPDILRDMPFFYQKLGRWWGNNPKMRRQEEIDILAFDDSHILIGECKWNEAPVSLPVLQQMIEKGTLFMQPQKYYYLFAKNGIAKDAEEFLSVHDDFKVVTFKDIMMYTSDNALKDT